MPQTGRSITGHITPQGQRIPVHTPSHSEPIETLNADKTVKQKIMNNFTEEKNLEIQKTQTTKRPSDTNIEAASFEPPF